MLTVSQPHWVYPRRVCFPCQHCLGSRLLFRELSEASPGLYALPKSKPLRFRYLDIPQRRRQGWACVLCTSQVQYFPGGSDGKASAYNAGAWVKSLGWEDLLEKEMATHSSILVWKIPWTEKPGRQQSTGSQRVRHD